MTEYTAWDLDGLYIIYHPTQLVNIPMDENELGVIADNDAAARAVTPPPKQINVCVTHTTK